MILRLNNSKGRKRRRRRRGTGHITITNKEQDAASFIPLFLRAISLTSPGVPYSYERRTRSLYAAQHKTRKLAGDLDNTTGGNPSLGTARIHLYIYIHIQRRAGPLRLSFITIGRRDPFFSFSPFPYFFFLPLFTVLASSSSSSLKYKYI